MNQCTKPIQKMKQNGKEPDNYCDKVGKAIAIWGVIEKFQYLEKNQINS